MTDRPCRGCGAGIVWARTASGAVAPIDKDEAADGDVLLLRPRGLSTMLAVTLSKDLLAEAHRMRVPLHCNHFQTCPRKELFTSRADPTGRWRKGTHDPP